MILVEKGFRKLLWIQVGRMSMSLCLVLIDILNFVLVISKDTSQTSFIDLDAVMIGILVE